MPTKQENSPYWYVTFTDPATGKRIRKSSGLESKREAAALEHKLRRQALEQKQAKPESRSFDEIVTPYLKYCKDRVSKDDLSRITSRIRNLHHYFAGKRLTDFTGEYISIYKARRNIKPNTLRREMAEFELAINYCNREFNWQLTNPFADKKPPQQKGRTRWIKKYEAQQLLAAAESMPRAKAYLPDYIRLRLLTGTRPGELAALRWDQIDFERKVIDLLPDDQKNREHGLIPLVAQAILILNSRRTEKNPTYVFQWRDGHIKRIHKSFRAACAAAGIEDFKPHDLRHTTASWVLNSGKHNLKEVGGLLRHKDLKSTDRYAHLAMENITQAAAAIGEV